MELPDALRRAVDDILRDTPLAELKRAGEALSRRYRAETRDGRLHLSDDLFAKAYLAARLPATYAAVRASLEFVAERDRNLAPASLLDVGAGPGTVLWAARECWPGIVQATLVEASEPIRRSGEHLAAGQFDFTPVWMAADVISDAATLPPADLVSLSYVLDELAPAAADILVDRLWAAAGALLVVIEPGTPAGWRRILRARDRLIAQGAYILAPCPHTHACPIVEPDWCHFSRRVSRSRVHRLAKGAEVPWEDEKFIYLAAARHPSPPPTARVLAPPRAGSGKISLKLCQADGTLANRLVTKRDGDLFRQARRLHWGDELDETSV